MLRRACLALFFVVCAAAPGQESAQKADPPAKTTSPQGAGDVDVQFLDGSKVRMAILSEKLEVDTAFGKLSVPVKAVRSIEFGMRMPEGVAGRIAAAVKSLGSADFREREKANKALLDLGPYSYSAVSEASQAKDLEVAGRAKDLLQKLKKKHAKNDLKVGTDDRIVTSYFTIVGRIVTPSVKTSAIYFGIVEHQLANMRTLRAIASPGLEMEVAVDAAKYGNGNQWLDTEFQVDGQSPLVVTAKGAVDTWPQQPGQWMAGPGGVMGAGGRMGGPGGGIVIMGNGQRGGIVNPQQNGGALLGKIGENGAVFHIGDRFDGTPETEGKLYLQIAPSPWGTNSTGKYDVTIKRAAE